MKGLLKGEINEVWGKGKWHNLFAPVDIAAVVLFRIAFGGILFWEVTRYFNHNWIYRYWVEPLWNFSYGPFNFSPMGETAMYALWVLLGILALFIAFGFLGFEERWLVEGMRIDGCQVPQIKRAGLFALADFNLGF